MSVSSSEQLKKEKRMKLWLPKSHAFMATPLAFRSIRRACFASSGLKWEGGVSMVQGASRGIGLEFVSFYFSCFMQSSCLLIASIVSCIC